MTTAEDAALAAIVAAPEAWSRWDEVDRAEPGTLDALVSAGWVERWDRPDYAAVTLTPWAAERLGVEVRERWALDTEAEPDDDRPGKFVRVVVAEEVPYWQAEGRPERRLAGLKYAHEVPLRCPEKVVDTRGEPEYVPSLSEFEDGPLTIWGMKVVRSGRWADAREQAPAAAGKPARKPTRKERRLATAG